MFTNNKNLDFDSMSLIIPKLFLGDNYDAHNLQGLHERGITHILNVAADVMPEHQEKFTILHIPAIDTEDYDMMQHWVQTGQFIHSALQGGGSVLVHCRAGISRSPITVMAYLIEYLGYGITKARNHVKSMRNQVFPNESFQKQLENYAHKIQNKKRESMKAPQKNIAGTQKQQAQQKSQQQKNSSQSENEGKQAKEVQIQQAITEEEKKSDDKEIISQAVQIFYSCQNCRKQLFSEQEIVHSSAQKSICTSIFVSPEQGQVSDWLLEIDSTPNDVKILCPKCQHKLGEIVLSGKKCNCKKWIVPAYQFLRVKIDVMKPLAISQQQGL